MKMSGGDYCHQMARHCHLCPLPQLRASLALESKHVIAQLVRDSLGVGNDESVLALLFVLHTLFCRPALPLCGVDVMHDSGENHHTIRGPALENLVNGIIGQEILDDVYNVRFQHQEFVEVGTLVERAM